MEQTAGIRITICNKISGKSGMGGFSQSKKRSFLKGPITAKNCFENFIKIYLQANIFLYAKIKEGRNDFY